MDSNNLIVFNVSKRFFGVQALDKVSFDLKKGEIMGLVGENGAGKSSIIKILAGAYKKDEGEIYLDGDNFSPRDPYDSLAKGIAVIHQERQLIPDLPISMNLFLDRLPEKKFLGLIPVICGATLMKKSIELLESLGIDLNPKTPVSRLNAAEKQIIDIAKAVSSEAKIVIMDEPTASLEPKEVQMLFTFIRKLKNSGTSVVFVSHRIEEVIEISDRIIVLRDGRVITVVGKEETNAEEIIKYIVGHEVKSLFPKETAQIGQEALCVNNLRFKKVNDAISFNVKAGEILALTGLLGSGAGHTLECLSGKIQFHDGEVTMNGEKIEIKIPADVIEKGIGYVPDDRKNEGIIAEMSVEHNILLPNLSKVTRFGFISRGKVQALVEPLIKALNIKTPSPQTPVKNLSGGNQQKVVIAKWLASDVTILLLNQPTHGVDVGAKAEVHKLLGGLVKAGGSVIFASSDLPEVVSASDRVIVFYKANIAADLDACECDQEKVLKCSFGL
ncbi:MAG: sugar ABC transporter ATP-binding protein [Bacillota bacterium]|nr:sugar ABC transporter ATP-binding protein [Bacillota bacterium]